MSAVRKLAAPIADLTSFATLVQTIMDTNPWGCTSYSSAGVTIPGMVKGTEGYTGTIVYENAEAKTVGRISVKSPTAAAFNSNITTILGTAALGTAMGGSPSHDSSEDGFSVALKCHHTNGELYSVTIKRDSITLSSYEDDTIRTSLETWADGIAELA
jgi:hypothetical protein